MENKRHIELGAELGHECRVLATGCSRVVVNVVHVDNKAGVEGEQQQSDRVAVQIRREKAHTEPPPLLPLPPLPPPPPSSRAAADAAAAAGPPPRGSQR
jgi:hypothetical protein